MQVESGERRKNRRRISSDQNMQKLWWKTLLFHVLSRRKRALCICEDCTVMTWKSATESLYFAHLGFKLSITCVVWSIFWQIVLVNFLQAISSHPIRLQVSKLLALNVVVSSEKINRQYGVANCILDTRSIWTVFNLHFSTLNFWHMHHYSASVRLYNV